MVINGIAKPPLLAIIICENSIQGEDETTTLVRVIDTFNFMIESDTQSVLDATTNAAFTVACDLFTRWGIGEGEFEEEMRVVDPHGNEMPQTQKIDFKKPSGFHFQQIRRRIRLDVIEQGVYSFRIYLNGELMGEHPFRVIIEQRLIDKPPNA